MTRTDRRRFLVLFAAIAALLALSGALALPLQAQTTTTFVSNTGEAPGSNSSSIQAQSFTTGSNADGYTLSEVAVRHVFSLSKDGTMVKVMSDNGSGRPGDLVADLDNPSSFTNNSILSFTAPASTETLERASTPAAVMGMTTPITASRKLSKSSLSERRAP